MKNKIKTIFGVIMLASLIHTGCGSTMTICDCLKDDGSHLEECDELAKSMTSSERREEIAKCK
ncbi:MAG: hypothetical protein RIQ47_1286 [Bacteroidota bacterium]|jgi:hypothetical protein